MSRTLRAALFAALVWLPAGHSSAQTSPTRLVKLPVVALDAHNQPVADLTVDDFALTDAGKPQTIAIFHRSDAAARPLETPPPGAYSNRTAANVPRATFVLFDMFNQALSQQASIRDFITRSLEPLESADYLYLYFLTPKADTYPVHALPTLSSPPADPKAGPWTKGIRPLMETAYNATFRIRPPELTIHDRVRFTYRALDLVAGALSALPGRKSLVWITNGVPLTVGSGFDESDYTPKLREMAAKFNRGGITVYPVQLLGDSVYLSSQDTLNRFADLTGGPRLASDIGVAVRQAMQDVRASYLLGYDPGESNWDGELHRLRVTCSRKGVRLQTLTAYYAAAPPPADDATVMETAFASPFEAADIGIRGAVATSAPPAGSPGRMTHLRFRVDPADIRIVPNGARFALRLALQYAGIHADGKSERLRITPVDLDLSADDRTRLLRDGLPVVRDILLGDNIRKVRLVVFDRAAHALGSLTVPVPPAPAK